jgi:hypothetical protein
VHPSKQGTYTRKTPNQKKKKNQKLTETINMETIIRSHPMENGVKEKGI